MFRRIITTAVALGLVVPTLGFAPSAAAASRPCQAPGVVGQSVAEASATVRTGGCLPGTARDGRHFVIKAKCAPQQKVGMIIAQSKRGKLGSSDLLVLTKGSRKTAAGQACPAIAGASAVSALAGDYEGTFSLAGQPSRFIFAIKGLAVTGGISGTLTWAPTTSVATGVLQGILHGFPCSGPATFHVATGGAVEVETGEWTCDREGQALPAEMEIMKIGS